jgi:hypothetical protein
MSKYTKVYVGLDVHKESIAVAYAPDEQGSDVCYLGPIGTRKCDLGKVIRQLQSKAPRLRFVTETLANSQTGKKLLRVRQLIVEGVIGEAKNFHLLSRCRYRRLHRFRIQLFLTAAVINLKRLMKEKTRFIGCRAVSAFIAISNQVGRAISV